jgi:hypothetical protein
MVDVGVVRDAVAVEGFFTATGAAGGMCVSPSY